MAGQRKMHVREELSGSRYNVNNGDRLESLLIVDTKQEAEICQR